MQQEQFKVIVGGLLHDIGKLICNNDDYSESGYEFLMNQVKLDDPDILKQVRYHNVDSIKDSNISCDSLAYITYIADNIAVDRRKNDTAAIGSLRELPLNSIFNLLNGNSENKKYEPCFLNEQINYPTETVGSFSDEFYDKCLNNIKNNVSTIESSKAYINSLLETLEENLSYITSSTAKSEVSDISLFDHLKLTAAFGSVIYAYLEENGITDYKTALFKNANDFYQNKTFLIYSMDISGIQDFIYTISSDGALKMLRTRSFYLELILEYLIDDLLEKLGLSRANLIYCGGGHVYILAQNTANAKKQIYEFEKNSNLWFLKKFSTALYLAGGWAECSANDINNEPKGSYKNIFREISNNISCRKLSRYTPQEIIELNNGIADGERECKVCRRMDLLSSSEKCAICEGMERFSTVLQNNQFFTVVEHTNEEKKMPLPNGRYIVSDIEETLLNKTKNRNSGYIRSYSKNNMFTGKANITKIWVGDYQNGSNFHDFAMSSTGIKRIAVIRADVDNLGQAFVRGFESEKNQDYYVTLTRTSTFSRKLSIFFKRHINTILEEGCYFLTDNDDSKRKATIVYSGGDDVFIIGEWSDIIGFAVDLNKALEKYSQGTLTMSAGIGIYPERYPVSAMARETGELEDTAKSFPGKNAVTLFNQENTYNWSDFINKVLEEKYCLIKNFFELSNEYGKNYLYNLLDLMQNRDNKLNIPRYAYFLARMQPDDRASEEQKQLYKEFSQKMFDWMRNSEDCRQAITAIYIYIYTIRDKKED